MDSSKARPLSAPALSTAGALVIGSGAGALASAPFETCWLVCSCGALAAAAGGALRFEWGTLVWLAALASLAGVRAERHAPSVSSSERVDATGSTPRTVPDPWCAAAVEARGVARPQRSQRGAAPGERRWALHTRRGDLDFDAARGVLRKDEGVAILDSAGRLEFARGTYDPVRTRRVHLAPLADEILRIDLADGRRGAREPADERGAVERLRARGQAAVRAHPDPDTAGLLSALLFGDTSALPPGVVDLFTRTGTRHMLALSGLHVGLVGALIAWPLARVLALLLGACAAAVGLRSKPMPGIPLALLAVLFVPVAGYGAPATRAALALAFAAVGPALPGRGAAGRRPFGLNLLGVALTFEIMVDPRAALRPGVQLSYLATSALIAAGPGAHRKAKGRLPGGGTLSRVGRTGRARSEIVCVAFDKLTVGFAGGIAASVVATLATLPVVWSSFGEWSPVGIVATPIVFAPMVVLVGGGWLWLACPLEGAGNDVLAWGSRTMLEILHVADHVPWSPMPLPERPLLLVATAAAAGLLGCRSTRPNAGRHGARVSAALFALALFPWGLRDVRASTLEVHVAAVGDGTAIVVRAPGTPTLLFDAGSRNRLDVGRGAVGPLLRRLDVGRVAVALSHDHGDHARALPWLTRRWTPEVWIGPFPSTRERGRLGPVLAAGARHVEPERGALSVRLGAGVVERGALEVVAVRGATTFGNEGSLTIDVRWRGARVVLFGDAEGHGLAGMLVDFDGAPALERGPVDAVLLPHHGSSSRHLGWLLDHLEPREVWISASEVQPGPERECARRGIPLRATPTSGPFVWSPSFQK